MRPKRILHPQMPIIAAITLLFLLLSAANVWARPAQDAQLRWTIPTFTPTPTPDTGVICVEVYRDRNGDGVRQPTSEELLPGASLWLQGTSTGVALAGTTVSKWAPYCFRGLPPDTYLVRVLGPSEYQATSPEIWGAIVLANTTVHVPFGRKLVKTLDVYLPLLSRLYRRSR